MIIDCHVHLNNYHEQVAISLEASLDKLLASMEEAGVGHALVLTSYLVSPHRPSAAEVVRAVERIPSLDVVTGISYNHYKERDLRELAEFLEAGLLKGLKLYPGYEHFYPHDRRLQVVYELAEEFDVLDIAAAADAVLSHLHELGHRRIGYLRGARPEETMGERHERWAAQLRSGGVDPATMPVSSATFDPDATIAAGRELLKRRDEITAVMCDDDVLAAGMAAAAREAGVDVPGELSITGFDDLDLARLTAPPLTTVRFHPEALGEAAFAMLHARLRGEEPESRVLPVELVVRGSTGPARSD